MAEPDGVPQEAWIRLDAVQEIVRTPYRRVFLRRIVRLGGRGLLFQASVERMLPLRARIALLRRLLRWRSGT